MAPRTKCVGRQTESMSTRVPQSDDNDCTPRRPRGCCVLPIWRLCQRVRVQKALVDSIVVEFEEHANVESNDDGSTEAGHSEATAGEASLAEEDHIRHEALGREAETLAAQFGVDIYSLMGELAGQDEPSPTPPAPPKAATPTRQTGQLDTRTTAVSPLVKRRGEVARADHSAIGNVSVRCGHTCAVFAVKKEWTSGWTGWRTRLFGTQRVYLLGPLRHGSRAVIGGVVVHGLGGLTPVRPIESIGRTRTGELLKPWDPDVEAAMRMV
jgi:hypothetical protein